MRRETQNVLLVLLGGALLKIAWTGTYLRYVKPSLLPFLAVAAVVILALGLIAIARDLRAGRALPAGFTGAAHSDHAARSPWLLLLPVLAIFLVSPPALGSDTVTRSAAMPAVPGRSDNDFPPLPSGPAPQLRLSDFVARAVWDDAGSVNGRQVRLLGFVARGAGGDTYLARLVITCCAADATAMKVRLVGRSGLATLPPDSWWEVRGQVVPGSARQDSRFVPTFTVSGLAPTTPPPETYEY
ncbi:MAG TPA: TIGR03943 family protein [Pseudonocardiaceae bacterium]